MIGEDGKIRLPELAIFRRYSLALRQEFSEAEDILAALRDTYAQVEEAAGLRAEGLPPAGKSQAEAKPPLDSPESGRSVARPPSAPQPERLPEEPADQFVHSSSYGSASRLTGGSNDDDPKSYLKRLAARPLSEDPLDELVAEETARPAAPREPLGHKPAARKPASGPAPANFEAWEGADEAGKPTSEEDEEHFWNRAKRRPKRQRSKPSGVFPQEDE